MKDETSDRIDLTTAVNADIPSLINIHKTAFALDNAARLMFKDEAEDRKESLKMHDEDREFEEVKLHSNLRSTLQRHFYKAHWMDGWQTIHTYCDPGYPPGSSSPRS